jgi:hypothetical protein
LKGACSLKCVPFHFIIRRQPSSEMKRSGIELVHGETVEGRIGSLLTKVCVLLFYYTATAVQRNEAKRN